MSFLSALVPMLPSFVSSGLEFFSTRYGAKSESAGQASANLINYQIAKENREWQKEMSDTAHQREVKDLRKAGLNPMLSVGSAGASTPQGSTAQMVNERAGRGMLYAQSAKMVSDIVLNLAKIDTEKMKQEKGSQIIDIKRVAQNVAKAITSGSAKTANIFGKIFDYDQFGNRRKGTWTDKTGGIISEMMGYIKNVIGNALK